MKSTFMLLTFTLLSTTAFSQTKDILFCTFTEPFIDISFEAETGLITYVSVDSYDEVNKTFTPKELAKNGKLIPVTGPDESAADFYPVEGSQFELKDDNDDLILSLTLDFQGSDGMSDTIYPFTAKYLSIYGGCETQKYPAVDTLDIFDGLKR